MESIAWAERLTQRDAHGKSCFRCHVPGCNKTWDQPVVLTAVSNHVTKSHAGMKLRWMHERARLTPEEQVRSERESTKRYRMKSRALKAEQHAPSPASVLLETPAKKPSGGRVPAAPAGPPFMFNQLNATPHPFNFSNVNSTQANTGGALPWLPPFPLPALPYGFVPTPGLITSPPMGSSHASFAMPPPPCTPPMAPAAAGAVYDVSQATADGPFTPSPGPSAVPSEQVHMGHFGRAFGPRTLAYVKPSRMGAYMKPTEEARLADPATASLLGSCLGDGYSSLVTERLHKPYKDTVVGAALIEEGIMKNRGMPLTFQASLRLAEFAPGQRIRMSGTRQKQEPVALRVAGFWVKRHLPELWTRLRCPGPIITDRFGGDLPPMRVDVLPMEGETTGMSMAMAVAASMVSCLTGCGVRRGLGVSASMDISGRLWAVDGLGPKSAAMKAIGIKRILFPPRSENILEVTGLEMKVCREGMEAIMLLLEPHPLPQPAVDFSRHERGLLGVSQSLAVVQGSTDFFGQPVPEGATGSVDTVQGQIQVVECYVLTGPGEASVEVLGHDEAGLHDIAAFTAEFVVGMLAAGTLEPEALPAWPLPDGHHFHIYFNFPPGDENDLNTNVQASMMLALVGALTGRAPRPGVAVVGEHNARGYMLPIVSASFADLRIIERTDGLKRLVIVQEAVFKLKSLLRREASARLREMQMEIVGGKMIKDFIDLALEPPRQQA